MARTSLFRPPASQPARIRQSNNQFFPSENLVNEKCYINSTLGEIQHEDDVLSVAYRWADEKTCHAQKLPAAVLLCKHFVSILNVLSEEKTLY
ncbi:hypothetical protein DPMN_051237 [Dreissena polymorpha]|uniref:Uncharacterized protein n=1 Tax=Dreissena polymorpha TaxID=45954 RepID=A0A9D4CHI6_DREPO|nr:hypothetical protein DPMN_051237 [Dreissena polymorpha]